MIKLFAPGTTTFDTNGLGALSDAASCTVTEELNGIYELEMEYPITGIHFSDIALGCYIYTTPSEDADPEPFEIYQITRPIGMIVTVYAWHISYRASSIPVVPNSPTKLIPHDPTTIFNILKESWNPSVDGRPLNDFTFWSDISDSLEFEVLNPESLRSILGRMQKMFGGEFKWEGTKVNLLDHRGLDNGVTIRYGKNLTDIKQEESIANTINGIVPYWLGMKDKKQVLVTIDNKVAIYQVATDELQQVALDVIAGMYGNGDDRVDALTDAGYDYNQVQSLVNKLCYGQTTLWMDTGNAYPRVIPYDMSRFFEKQPTKNQLSEQAVILVQKLQMGVPMINLEVSFAQLNKTKEYRDLEVLQTVKLGDTVHVYFENLGVTGTSKVIKTVYNCITNIYDSVELGDSRATLTTSVASVSEKIAASEARTSSSFSNALSDATDSINGASGGYVVIEEEGGHPSQIMIMDAATKAEARNCIRMNQAGIGFSTDGGRQFNSAWSIDGTFDAAQINVINLDASRINAGYLQSTNYVSGESGFSLSLIDGTISAPKFTVGIETSAVNLLKQDEDIDNMIHTFSFTADGLVTKLRDDDSPYNTLVASDGFYIRENTTDIGHFNTGGLWANAVSIGSSDSGGELYLPPLVIKAYDTDNNGVFDSWVVTKV